MTTAFDIQTTGFSLANAVACAEASALAYAAPATLQTDLTHVIVSETENALVLAFRGTASLRDFITDADFPQRTLVDEQKVHCGFLDSVEQVIDQVAGIAAKSVKPIFMTGHSLGGAQASLCAHLFATRKIPLQGVYTFGKPRVGNRNFASAYDASLYSKSFRFVRQEDIVPRVPWLYGRYHHEGQLVFLPSTGGFSIEAPLALMIMSDIYGFWRAYLSRNLLCLNEFLLDHHMDGYAADVSALYRRASILQQLAATVHAGFQDGQNQAPESSVPNIL